MIELLKAILGSIKGLPLYAQASLLVIFAGLVPYVVHFHRVRYRHLYDKRKIQIDKLDEYLSRTPPVSDHLREILLYEREDQIFAHVFGFSLEATKRRLLIPIIQADNPPFSWSLVKEIRPYLRVQDPVLLVKYSKWEKWDFRLTMLGSFIFFVFGSLCILGAIAAYETTRSKTIAFAVIAIIMLGVSANMFLSTLAFSTTRRLEKWLKSADNVKT